MGIEKTSSGKRQRTTKQIELGQFFTPVNIAEFMSSIFDKVESGKRITLLDPGAGQGQLGISVIERFRKSHTIEAYFVELDPETLQTLNSSLDTKYRDEQTITCHTEGNDFIDKAIEWSTNEKHFTHIIINPPYFKIRENSTDAKKLRTQGIFATNMYAAFVWLSIKLLSQNGELVAIIPRSFCNGPYFLKFREYIAKHCSIETIHIMHSRKKAFSNDGVLQENIIIRLKKQKQSEFITIMHSADDSFVDLQVNKFSSEQIINPDDKQLVVHIPTGDAPLLVSSLFANDFSEIGLNVSTGPVVDFRLKDHIFAARSVDAQTPLIYPAHMRTGKIIWPLEKINKNGQFFALNQVTQKWVVPLDGYHVIVRRFSSKEERRRIFAAIVDPNEIDATQIAYENHVNFFHINKSGLDKDLAYGLYAFLNSYIVDVFFRSFSGHTQVNVSDLKRLRYPSIETLRRIGTSIQKEQSLEDEIINETIRRFE